jgi:NADH-quinone oxidoreductase subunit M
MIPFAILIATILPALSGLGIYASRKYLENRQAGLVATGSALISILLILSLAYDVVNNYNNGLGPLLFEYPWIEAIDINFGFLVDVVSLPMGLIVAIVSTLACFYSIEYMKEEQSQPVYYTSLLVFMTGMLGVMFSVNLIQFYLFWELMLIPSYFLIALWGTSERRLSIGFKYFIFTHVGALSMLLGILAIFSYTGTFSLVQLPVRADAIPNNMNIIVFVLLSIGFFVKMAVFPVHTWLPDAHSEAPTPISAMLSGIMVKCGVYGMARILLSTFGPTVSSTSDILAILGVITIAYGGLMALAQHDIKRLLAYSSISQLGYILFGLGTASTLGITGGLLHAFNHALGKSLLFMCAGIIIHQTGTRDIREMGGLMDKMLITSIACMVGAFSLIGIPPLNGFWSEWMIFGGGLASGKILITFLGVISTLITAGYYLWFIWRVFFGSVPENLNNVKDPPRQQLIPLIILAVACLVLGLYPGPLLAVIRPAAEYLSSFLGG